MLDFYKYDGLTKTGFIFIAGNKFVFIGKNEDETIANFVQQYLAYMPLWRPGTLYFSPPNFDKELDKETADTIYQLKLNLDKLKENGQFFLQ